jgi:hypothetical protein
MSNVLTSLRNETGAADNSGMAEEKHETPDPVRGPEERDSDGLLPVRFLRVVDARRRLVQGWLTPQPELIARALILRAALD